METTEAKPESMPMPQPQKEHKWLHKLIGEWTVQEGEPHPVTGTETVRPLGEVWVLAEGQGEVPGGGTAHSLMTLGYNPETKRFVGTWVGSPMTHLWVYDGELDASERVLTLSAEGPDFEKGGTATYRDVIEFIDDDHRTLTTFLQDENGAWKQFMQMHYHRKR